MRYYVFTPGEPGFVWAEITVSEASSAWAEEDPDRRREGLPGLPADQALDFRILTRADLVATASGQEALDRWERHDDAAFQAVIAERDRRADLRVVSEDAGPTRADNGPMDRGSE